MKRPVWVVAGAAALAVGASTAIADAATGPTTGDGTSAADVAYAPSATSVDAADPVFVDPNLSPSAAPTVSPSVTPTVAPSEQPTPRPTKTHPAPSPSPTTEPTATPTPPLDPREECRRAIADPDRWVFAKHGRAHWHLRAQWSAAWWQTVRDFVAAHGAPSTWDDATWAQLRALLEAQYPVPDPGTTPTTTPTSRPTPPAPATSDRGRSADPRSNGRDDTRSGNRDDTRWGGHQSGDSSRTDVGDRRGGGRGR